MAAAAPKPAEGSNMAVAAAATPAPNTSNAILAQRFAHPRVRRAPADSVRSSSRLAASRPGKMKAISTPAGTQAGRVFRREGLLAGGELRQSAMPAVWAAQVRAGRQQGACGGGCSRPEGESRPEKAAEDGTSASQRQKQEYYDRPGRRCRRLDGQQARALWLTACLRPCAVRLAINTGCTSHPFSLHPPAVEPSRMSHMQTMLALPPPPAPPSSTKRRKKELLPPPSIPSTHPQWSRAG